MAGFIGNVPAEKYTALQRQTFSSPTGTSHTLSYSVTNSDDLLLYINNVKQDPADYTASGTSLTTPTLVSGDEMYALFYGRATETVNPPDSSVSSAKLANDAVTAPKTDLSIVQGDVIYGSGTDAWARLGAGTSGQFLKTQGAGANPVWADASATTPVNKTGTRNMNTATGTQDITGFGFDPGYVTVRCSFTGSSGQDFMSFGSSDFTTQNCTNYQNGVAVNTFGYHLSAVANMEESSSQSQVATVASITGGIRLSWTKTGSPTSQTMTIFVTAWE